jgi:urate oxidase
VLKLAIAALEDPHCHATTLCVAQHAYEEFRSGDPLSLERYQAAVQQFDTISKAVLTEAKFRSTRAHLLFRLRVQLLMVYPAPVVGKRVACGVVE